jgi:hypothetical protein
MGLSPSWVVANHSNLRDAKAHYRVHKRPPLFPILSQIDAVHTILSYLITILILYIYLPSGLLSSGFPTNILYEFLCSPSCYVPCSPHPSWLDHSNYTWRRVQVMKFLIVRFSPVYYLGNYGRDVLLLRRTCPSYHQFYPLLGYDYSEQWYHTRAL